MQAALFTLFARYPLRSVLIAVLVVAAFDTMPV